jgi:nucleoside phosphorylase
MGASMSTVDVLWIAALKMELDAARDAALAPGVTPGQIKTWESKNDCPPFPYLKGEYLDASGRGLNIVLARPIHMGANHTASLAGRLIEFHKPKCVVMSGVCAGNPDDTAYGDIIITDMVYQYDNGKRTDKGFIAEHRQITPHPAWIHAAQDLTADALPSHGIASPDDAKAWLLEILAAGRDPQKHPAFHRFFTQDQWKQALDDLQAPKWITVKNAIKLTKAGARQVEQQKLFKIDPPKTLPFVVKAGPIASGNAVIKDGVTWDWLKDKGVRTVLGLEMEAASLATACANANLSHWIVAKGVMDYADPHKDDRFKAFAATASAQVLLRFLWDQFTKGGMHASSPIKTPAAHPSPAANTALNARPLPPLPQSVLLIEALANLTPGQFASVIRGMNISPADLPLSDPRSQAVEVQRQAALDKSGQRLQLLRTLILNYNPQAFNQTP